MGLFPTGPPAPQYGQHCPMQKQVVLVGSCARDNESIGHRAAAAPVPAAAIGDTVILSF
jgi:hypothetical protein